MSGLVWTHTGSGVLIGSFASDEAACRSALRQHDRDLRLVPPGVFVDGEHVNRSNAYRVYRYAGSDRPLQFVCGWWNDYGHPYPNLSVTGLLEEVKRLDLNGRAQRESADEKNTRLIEAHRKDAQEQRDAIVEEFRDRIDGKKSSPLPRSRGLYLARSRVRERTKTNDLKP